MKKIAFIFLILFIVLAGCSDKQEEPLTNQNEEEAKNDDNVPSDKGGGNEEDEQGETAETDEADDQQNSQQKADKEEEQAEALEPQYRINPKTANVEPIADAEKKVVLLTIDDAPDKYSLEMAKTLKELGVEAIFFVNGHFIDSDKEKEVLKQIYDMGFPIGNHTWNHKKLPDLTEEQQKKEIVELSDEIENITGERPKFYRAPHGLNTDYSRQVVADEKMVLMNWSYGYDYFKEYMEKDALTDIMLNTNLLGSGANLLMHDREWTNAALKDIVVGLQEKGFTIVDPALIETFE
jgi:peptidoglycan/xylan/chitin deacetylase (PgdA/CDA1 family)